MNDVTRRQLRAMAILPGNVTLLVPAAIGFATRDAPRLAAGQPLLQVGLRGAGALSLCAGVALMAAAIGLFSTVGEGTLAPWDPTRKLVVRGMYRHVRNPMIGGVMAVLLGEALLFASTALLGWFLAFVLANALYIPIFEESGLERRFGEEYREYRRNVPRWIPRLSPWEPGRR
jgi:protein-S-isoprenylcysteine O-methyltransferase Ste14